ncbi:TPA: hypothetical protein QCV65_003925 [Bacillus thuringiensis]|uniref:YopX protein domain-containing protein n=5 Tax=Bacillus thuringiensis TaxID=1428 RepID=A0AAP4V434_BACTU|nr:hypothetical protein CAB88_32855 [Bacillus thuringiensis]EEM25713.1 hypothetical protein bthur0002_54620 [Bacillus thuringiensis Bt407]EEM31918.1 hypothetical protein bthur0003_55730 [Bacillus thuringiensis serovar thuringiensis str. T01001]EEM63040.1 hypothetical protein bthur0008_53550 [Bacillus thuringiensis serovar berliner ATCC 10792]KMQ12754.1 hypothetical protein TU66_14025 [Bacillus cereus]OIX18075.1 hypothetical protein BMT18_20065 [Bacillus thuringiensis serovar aizawai]PQZ68579.
MEGTKMREVEFRGKPIKDYGDAKWFYGSVVINYEDELAYIEAPGYGCVPIEWETVGQYIGLKDKYGKKIYEGDLFYWRDTLRQVVYREDKAAFMAKRVQGKSNNDFYFYMWNLQDLLERVEVIGNTYENPEFLRN